MADENSFSEALKKQQYGLLVVGSKSSDGEPNGMTANWASQVSSDPQIFAVAIQAGAHTRRNIDETGVFSISVLGEGTKDLSLKFTRPSTSSDGRLEDEPVSYQETGTPVLDSAVGWFECRVVGQSEPGDHVVYFGQVIAGGVADGAATDAGRYRDALRGLIRRAPVSDLAVHALMTGRVGWNGES
ncbi:MAG: flavin reductase family protein [Dehalococcoidia bacterium]